MHPNTATRQVPLWVSPATGSTAANEPFLSQAVEQIDRVIEEAGEGGRLRASRIVLVGFSQGACLAVEYALQRPGHVGAIIVFTGALIGPPDTVWPASPGMLAGLQVLLTGSDADEWITQEQTRHTAAVLADLGADVRLRIYHGRPHIVSEPELAEARELLTSLL